MSLSDHHPELAPYSSNRAGLLVPVLLTLWIAAFLASDEVRFYSGSVLDYFSAGFTSFKPLFALVWLLLCSVFVHLRRGVSISFASKWAAAFLLLGQMNSLLLHFWFSAKYHIGLFESAIISSARELSSNQLVHIHVSKGILYILLRGLGLEELQTAVDPGRAYAEILPGWIFLLQGVLVLGAGVSLLLALPALFRMWKPELRVSYAVMFAISSTAVLRCVLDGGPFDWTNIALAPVLYLLLLRSQLSLPLVLKRLLVLECLSFAVLWAVHLQASTPRWQGVICNSTLSLLFILSAGLAGAVFVNTGRRILPGVALVVTTIALCALSTNTFWSWEVRRAYSELQPGDSIFVEDFYDRFHELPELGREGKYVLRKLEVTEPQRLKAVYRELRLKIGQEVLNISGRGCDPAQSYSTSGRVIVLKGDLQEREFAAPILKNFFLSPCADARQCTFRFTAEMRGCSPNSSFEAIVNRLSEVGLERFLLVPDPGQGRRFE